MDFALTRGTPQPRPAVRMKMARMALIAGACIAAGVAFNIARDGGPPREGTRAEVSLPPSPIAPGDSSAKSPVDEGNIARVPDSATPALTLPELERRLNTDRDSRELVLR